MISDTESVQKLIAALEDNYKTILGEDEFPHEEEIKHLKNLSEAAIFLGKLFTELGRRLVHDVKWKEEEFQAMGKFDWQDFSLLLHPIDQINLCKLSKEFLRHFSTE